MKRKIKISCLIIIVMLLVVCFNDNNNKSTKELSNTDVIEKVETTKKEDSVITNEAIDTISEPEIEPVTSECVQSDMYNTNNCVQNEFIIGWVNSASNVRILPDITADIIVTLPIGTQIKYCKANEYWSYVQYNNQIYYIYNELISDKEITVPNYKDYNTPYSKRMSFMPYQAITSKSSPQYKLQRIAYTGNYGIRQVNGRYCVAVGSAYTTIIGQYFDLVLDNGTVIPCILADCKADIHTDSTNRISADGSLAEFVVDKHSLDTMTQKMGDIIYCTPEWKGTIVKIRIYDFVEKF